MSSVNLSGLLLLTVGAGVLGVLLGWVQRFCERRDLGGGAVNKINNLLPQTQCAGCGYPGCRPYAEALLAGEAINKCAPGGEALIKVLANTLNRPILEPDTAYGTAKPTHVVRIREADCIGCARCAIVCPVDAILGAPEQLHSVLANSCTGCDLCLPECPVDCIEILPVQGNAANNTSDRPQIVSSQAELEACIRCDLCSPVCPKELMPQLLYRACLDDDDMRADDLGLADCIECGRCNNVCPSQLPLDTTFGQTKAAMQARATEVAEAMAAKDRAEARVARKKRVQQAEDVRRKLRLQTIKTSLGEMQS